MSEQNRIQQNMISNLPLLFANGYPTSLEKIKEYQLENFIPFMVQCSLGHINLPKKTNCSEPEWWPEDVPFVIPLVKPKGMAAKWMEKMKEIVVICYQFHKSTFLLRFCKDLASYEQASLRFINNYNSTTSLYDRRSNKLLVTFRNENMSYDQQQTTRKCLLQRTSKIGGVQTEDLQHVMVEPAPFDIYLCDNCDAELYSKEAIMVHEKTCKIEDDVIICDSPDSEISADSKKDEDHELRKAFLYNFNLQSCKSPKVSKIRTNKEDLIKNSSERSKRFSRRNRVALSLARCLTIPLSSPAGQQLLRSTKNVCSEDYLSERFERLERFCHTPLLWKSTFNLRMFEKRSTASNIPCTFKKPPEYNNHIYVFPRRQFRQRRQTVRNFLFLNTPLIKQCRPIAVRLKKITDNEIAYQRTLESSNINIRLTRDGSQKSNWRISPSSVDTIDLCSSDDDDSYNKLIKPLETTDLQSEIVNSVAKTILNNGALSSSVLNTLQVSNEIMLAGNRISTNNYNNILLPSTFATIASSATTSEDSLLKPLRQSVYIFSNYKTDSVLNRYLVNALPSCSINDTGNTSTRFSSCRAESMEYNQENCINPKNVNNVSDWCTNPSNLNKNTSIHQSPNVHSENLTVNSFESPGRVISIDLTS